LRRWAVLGVLGLSLVGVSAVPVQAGQSQSDLNNDGVVDLEDLKILADKVLGVPWDQYDWCAWVAEDGRLQSKYDELVDFIRGYYQCDAPPEPPQPPFNPLAVEHQLAYPTRLAWAPDGKLVACDAKVGSVFIYTLATDAAGVTTLTLEGELKRLGKIVAVAVDAQWDVYVANSQTRRVDKYNLLGELVTSIGAGTIRMPSDLTFDADGNLYVADSQANVVWVFGSDGGLLRTIRRGGINTPMGVEVAYRDDGSGNQVGEVYVADKGTYLVKVYSLTGQLLRSYGGFVEKQGWFNPVWIWEGKFVSLQSLAIDGAGNLHALDCYMNKGQILNPLTGEFIAAYGETGPGVGQLQLPLDAVVSSTGAVVVADADNHRVEVIYQVP